MTTKSTLIGLLSSALVLGHLAMCAHTTPEAVVEVAAPIDFASHIKPILTDQCLPCHHSGTLLSEFNLETKERAFRATAQGLPIVPGYPEASLLWRLINEPHPIQESQDQMPSNGPRLSLPEKTLIYRWIEQGAPWPDAPIGRLEILSTPNEA